MGGSYIFDFSLIPIQDESPRGHLIDRARQCFLSSPLSPVTVLFSSPTSESECLCKLSEPRTNSPNLGICCLNFALGNLDLTLARGVQRYMSETFGCVFLMIQ
jgi:hypothetical protein